jgi:predicted O-linked N-acetylglucosamine transferase (SPINDLY family)
MDAYLAKHHEIDVALDPLPYCGGTTSCDALWMGVPVVTLAGETAVSRAGMTLLNQVGLAELVAHTPEEYLRIAAGLAGDPARLGHIRAGLRQRMTGSPLMDAARFARGFEAAFREMWRAWCARVGQRVTDETNQSTQ